MSTKSSEATTGAIRWPNKTEWLTVALRISGKRLAAIWDVAQSTVSNWCNGQGHPTPEQLERLLQRIAASPDEDVRAMLDKAREIVAAAEPLIRGIDLATALAHQAKTVPEFPGMEDAAMPWAITFDTPLLIAQLVHLAQKSNLVVKDVCADAVILAAADDRAVRPADGPTSRWEDVLYPSGANAGLLKPRTLIVFGSRFGHAFAERTFDVITQRLGLPVKFYVSNEFFFFGYQTTFVDISCQEGSEKRWYRPTRYVEDGKLNYKDYGVILSARAQDVVYPMASEHELSDAAELIAGSHHVYHVAGAHRLATGTGLRLLEDQSLLRQVLPAGKNDDKWNALVFEVHAQAGERREGEAVSSSIVSVKLLHLLSGDPPARR